MRCLKWMALAGVAAIALAGCATRGTPIAGQSLDRSYVTDGFTWQSGTTVYVLIKTFESEGKVGLCGAWSARGGANLVANFHTDVLAAGSIILDGSRIHQGLLFMREHGPKGKLTGKSTNCIRTGTDWRPEFESAKPDATFPRMRVNT